MKVLFKKFCRVRTLEEFVEVQDNATDEEINQKAKEWADNSSGGSKRFTIKVDKLGH